jgi:hypothetical protein
VLKPKSYKSEGMISTSLPHLACEIILPLPDSCSCNKHEGGFFGSLYFPKISPLQVNYDSFVGIT